LLSNCPPTLRLARPAFRMFAAKFPLRTLPRRTA
jgi:hypothetical protein